MSAAMKRILTFGNQIDIKGNGSEDAATLRNLEQESDDWSDEDDKRAAGKKGIADSDDEEKKEIIHDSIDKAASTN